MNDTDAEFPGLNPSETVGKPITGFIPDSGLRFVVSAGGGELREWIPRSSIPWPGNAGKRYSSASGPMKRMIPNARIDGGGWIP